MIGLIDIDGKLPNLALMKISNYYKSLGEQVEFAGNDLSKYEKVFASCLFSWNRSKCENLLNIRHDAEIGGTGWDIKKELPPEIEIMEPDYDIYTKDLVLQRLSGGISTRDSREKKARIIANMGIGFTSRGCIRRCGFCLVHPKEGSFRQESEIRNIINPRSNVITLYDNNLTADPYCIDKLHEIRDRGLTVDISQGIDVRLITPEKAKALSGVKHLRSLHYAWDLMENEADVLQGIEILSQHVKKWRHMCFILCGFNTSFEEDLHRVQTLSSVGVKPYVMKYNNRKDNLTLNHFARWVNGKFFTVCQFEDYKPYAKVS